MNKGELLEKIYRDNDLTKQECRELVDSIVETIVDTVAEGEEVRLVNFGTFKPKPKKETVKRLPMTGEKIDVPAKVVPRFSSGKGFDETVKENLEAKKDGSGDLKVRKK